MKEPFENPEMTFIIKKRINTELFIETEAALYNGEIRNRVGTEDDDQPVVLADWGNKCTSLAQKYYLAIKRFRECETK